jgi:hypothetical protein
MHIFSNYTRKPYPYEIEDCAGKSSRLTKSPQAPRCRRERRLPLKAQTPLNPNKFAPTGSRTQALVTTMLRTLSRNAHFLLIEERNLGF